MSTIRTASNVHSRMIHNMLALFLRAWEEILSRTQPTENTDRCAEGRRGMTFRLPYPEYNSCEKLFLSYKQGC